MYFLKTFIEWGICTFLITTNLLIFFKYFKDLFFRIFLTLLDFFWSQNFSFFVICYDELTFSCGKEPWHCRGWRDGLDGLHLHRARVHTAILSLVIAPAVAGVRVGHLMLGILYPDAGALRRRQHHALKRDHGVGGAPDICKVDKRHRTAALRVDAITREPGKSEKETPKKNCVM